MHRLLDYISWQRPLVDELATPKLQNEQHPEQQAVVASRTVLAVELLDVLWPDDAPRARSLIEKMIEQKRLPLPLQPLSERQRESLLLAVEYAVGQYPSHCLLEYVFGGLAA